MRDGTPPRGPRGPRGSGENMPGRRYDRTPPPPSSAHPPYRSPDYGPAPSARPDNPYRPFGDPSNPRLPAPYQRGLPGTYTRLPAAGQDFAEMDGPDDAEPHHRRLGFAIFHDGNPGHLWRGSVASTLGEAILSAGVLMWLVTLTLSPLDAALAVAAFGLPFLLAGPLAARLEASPEPGGPLRWIGRLRVIFALALIAMHFQTILPVVYLLLFAISFCGRLHDALRVAAIRTCLARGEPAHVSNDLHIGSALAAVLGPLAATFCYILLGERILLVAIVAAAFFLISLNSEGFLDTLPPNRRDFLLATPESAMSGDDWPDALPPEDDAADDDIDPGVKRELSLPAWYQLGPSSAGEAIGEIRGGLMLAGTTQATAAALWALAALGLAGGGLAVIEAFYLIQSFGLPPFYLGPLFAAEGAGLALGALLSGPAETDGPWRSRFLAGLAGSGIALVALSRLPTLPLALVACFALGACNALAVQAARQGLLAGFTGYERRALAAAESAVVAVCAVLGTLLVAVVYGGDALPVRAPISLATWPASGVIFLTGAGLLAATVIFALLLSVTSKATPEDAAPSAIAALGATGTRLPALDDEDDEGDDYPPMTGEHDAWDESDADDYAASYGHQRTGYGPAARTRRGGNRDYDDEDDTGQSYDDDYDDQPPRRPGSSARRPLRENRRPRW